jgi:hypothetical protein
MSEDSNTNQNESEIRPGVFYIEAADSKTGEPLVMEAPFKIPRLVRDLKHTLDRYGDSFGSQIITVSTYVPVSSEQPNADDENPPVQKLQKQVVSQGQPAAVIKELEDMCLPKERLAKEIMNILGSMSRSSGLMGVTITYLVEDDDGSDVLTGGNTLLFVSQDEMTDMLASQLYNSVQAHGEQLREMFVQDGHTINDQDGPQILTPGDAGFHRPQGLPG